MSNVETPHMPPVGIGEIYGKQQGTQAALYQVVAVVKDTLTLENLHNPLSRFETTAKKLHAAGYTCISHKPYVPLTSTEKATDTSPNTLKLSAGKSPRKRLDKPKRCPFTVDFLENRADHEMPLLPQQTPAAGML